VVSIFVSNGTPSCLHHFNISITAFFKTAFCLYFRGPSWSWSYGSWIDNYLCNQCISSLTLWVRIQFRGGVLDTTLCGNFCQWLAAGLWFSPGSPVSSTNNTDHHNITEMLLKVALNTITLTPCLYFGGFLWVNCNNVLLRPMSMFRHEHHFTGFGLPNDWHYEEFRRHPL